MLSGTRVFTQPTKLDLSNFSDKEIQLIVATAKVIKSFSEGHDILHQPPSKDGKDGRSIASKLLKLGSMSSSAKTSNVDDSAISETSETTNT